MGKFRLPFLLSYHIRNKFLDLRAKCMAFNYEHIDKLEYCKLESRINTISSFIQKN